MQQIGMRVRVASAHTSNYPNPISFEKGDRLRVGVRDAEYAGWVRVTTGDGNEGWAPEQFVDLLSDVEAVANCRYSARELNTSLGQILVVHRELNGWCWVENEGGDFGWVPEATIA